MSEGTQINPAPEGYLLAEIFITGKDVVHVYVNESGTQCVMALGRFRDPENSIDWLSISAPSILRLPS